MRFLVSEVPLYLLITQHDPERECEARAEQVPQRIPRRNSPTVSPREVRFHIREKPQPTNHSRGEPVHPEVGPSLSSFRFSTILRFKEYRAYSKLRSHTFEQSVCVTLNLTSTEKQSVCVTSDLTSTKQQSVWTLNDLKFSEVRERRVCADLEFSTSTCTGVPRS